TPQTRTTRASPSASGPRLDPGTRFALATRNRTGVRARTMSLTHRTPLRVLLAEDDASLREVLTQSLVEEGFEVTAAANGAGAFQRFARSQPASTPRAINIPARAGPPFAPPPRRPPTPPAPTAAVPAAGAPPAGAERIKAAAWLNKPFDVCALMRLLTRLPA